MDDPQAILDDAGDKVAALLTELVPLLRVGERKVEILLSNGRYRRGFILLGPLRNEELGSLAP